MHVAMIDAVSVTFLVPCLTMCGMNGCEFLSFKFTVTSDVEVGGWGNSSPWTPGFHC